MAYQPKSYRKFVATAATATLVASAVAPAALAASSFTDVAPKYKEAVDYLFDNGITQGKTEELFGTHQNITRGELAIWLTRALQLETEGAAPSGFEDTAGTYYDAHVSVLKEEGILDGLSADEFGVNAFVTRGQMAKLLSNAYGLTSEVEAPFEDMGQWAPYINGLYAYEITSGKTEELFGTGEAITRGDLAIFMFRADTLDFEGTPEFDYEGELEIALENGAEFTTPEVTAVDTEDGDVEVTTVITDAEGNELEAIDTKVEGTYTITYTAEDADGNVSELVLTVEVAEATTVVVESVSAINSTTLELELNKELENLDGLTFSAKRGSTNVLLSAKLSETKDSVLLSSVTKLAAGDYTVTVTGGDFVEGSNSATVKVEAEKETTLTIQNESVQMINPAKISFEVKNQYGEVMNVVSSNVVATAYDKTAGTAPNATGTIALSPVAGKTQFTGDFTAAHLAKGDEVLLTFSYKGLTAAKTITVLEASGLNALELQAPQPLKDKVRITTGETIELPYVAVDQYGEEATLASYTDALADDQAKIGDYLFTSSNPAVVDADSIAVDADGKATFVAGAKGTAKITAVNVKTGEITSVDVEVAAVATEDSISLTAPNELIVAGETVKVPFTAYDQFGDAIKTANLTTANITLASSDTSKATVSWNADKEIVISGVAAGTTEISATIGTKVVKFSVDVLAAAVPTKITAVKDLATVLTKDAVATIDPSNVVVKDQYGRDFELSGSQGIAVYVKDGSETSVDVQHTAGDVTAAALATAGLVTADGTTSVATLTGTATTGTENVVLQLVSDTAAPTTSAVAGGSYEFGVTTKAATDITSYTLGELPTLFDATNDTIANAGTYSKDLEVTAKDAAGNVVAIPASSILSVTSSDSTVAIVDKATMKIAGKAKGTATITVLVQKGDGSTQALTKTVTVSDVAPLAEKVAFDDADGRVAIAAASAGTIATATGVAKLVITDQYGGKALTANDIVVTTVTDAGNDNTYSYNAATGVLTVTNAASGDKFVLTAVSNGSTDTLEVTVTP